MIKFLWLNTHFYWAALEPITMWLNITFAPRAENKQHQESDAFYRLQLSWKGSRQQPLETLHICRRVGPKLAVLVRYLWWVPFCSVSWTCSTLSDFHGFLPDAKFFWNSPPAVLFVVNTVMEAPRHFPSTNNNKLNEMQRKTSEKTAAS